MTSRRTSTQVAGLAGWLLLTFAAAAIGAAASVNAGAFYSTLNRPSWAPPAWLFGPVWTALYSAMAVSAWLVWRSRAFVARVWRSPRRCCRSSNRGVPKSLWKGTA